VYQLVEYQVNIGCVVLLCIIKPKKLNLNYTQILPVVQTFSHLLKCAVFTTNNIYYSNKPMVL